MFAREQAPYTCAAALFMSLQPLLVTLSKNKSGGFNYSGAIELGNVVKFEGLGLGTHNVEWETSASLAFLRAAAKHVSAGRAAGYYLHHATTLR